MPNGIYIQASSIGRVSTFLMEFTGKNKNQTLELR